MNTQNQSNISQNNIFKSYFIKNDQDIPNEDQDSSNIQLNQSLSVYHPHSCKQRRIDDYKDFIQKLAITKELKDFQIFNQRYHPFLKFLKRAYQKEKNREQQRKFIHNLIKKFLEQRFERSFYTNSLLTKTIVNKDTKVLKNRQNVLESVYDISKKNILEQIMKLKVSQKKFNLNIIYDLLKCSQTKQIIKRFLQSKQSTKMFLQLKKEKIKQSFDTFECQTLKINKEQIKNRENKQKELLDNRKFSKLPWSYKSFIEAKQNFLDHFFA